MHIRSQQLHHDFAEFKRGNIDALQDLLRAERPNLFDYVMRMTGQVMRAVELVDESLTSLEHAADDCDNLQELLVLIYKTTRKFASDVWNADISKLENASYGATQGRDIQILVRMEQIVRSLPATQREILLLRDRFGFVLDEVAEITAIPLDEVELVFAQAHSVMEYSSEEPSHRIPELIGKLHPFLEPIPEAPETQNLSIIMNDFKKSNRAIEHGRGVLKVGLFILLLVVLWLKRQDILTAIEQALGWASKNAAE